MQTLMTGMLPGIRRFLILSIIAACLAPAALAQTAPAAVPPDPAAADEVVVLDVFDVTTSGDAGYLSTNAESATRMNVPLGNIPQSVLVFNSEFLDDIMAETVDDFAMYDPSVQTVSEDDNFNMRGFDQAGIYYNGFPMESGYGKQLLVNIDRAEILKGPNGVLYGQGAFGGTKNLVSKKAMFKIASRANLSYDSNGYGIAKIDYNQPLVRRKLAFRLNALVADGEDARGCVKSAWAVAPTFTWNITRRTTLIAEYIYQKQKNVNNVGWPVIGGNPFKMRMSDGSWRSTDLYRPLNDSDDLRTNTRQVVYADFRHEFSKHLMFRSMFGYEFKNAYQDEVYISIGLVGLHAVGDTMFLSPLYRHYDYDYTNTRTRNELVARFNTFGLKHQLIGGVSWDTREVRSYRIASSNSIVYPATGNQHPAIDIFNHVPAPAPAGFKDHSRLTRVETNSLQTLTMPAVYINDLVSVLNERLFFQFGFKYTETKREVEDYRPNRTPTSDTEKSTTHSLGLVYHLTSDKAWTLYLNNNTTYDPNFRPTRDGDLLDSRESIQYEVGLKYVYNDKLSAMLSIYDIKVKNEAIADPTDSSFYIGTDGRHSKGGEFILHWNATKAWQIYGGYAYTHCIDDETGKRYHNVPLHGVSMFTRYKLQHGPLKGLAFRFGYQWRDSSNSGMNSSAPNEPEWVVPTFINVTAGLSYEFRIRGNRYNISLQVKNLTDRINITNARNIYVRVADPRTVVFGIGGRF